MSQDQNINYGTVNSGGTATRHLCRGEVQVKENKQSVLSLHIAYIDFRILIVLSRSLPLCSVDNRGSVNNVEMEV